MSNGQYLTYANFLNMFDHEDILAVAGLGGYNSSAERVINQERVEAVIARVNSRIDGYVLARFPALLELASDAIPEALKGAAGDMVNYWLRDREGDRGTVDDLIKDRFNDAMKYLEGIGSGKIDLGIAPANGGNLETDNLYGEFPPSRSDQALEGYLS